MCVCAPCSQFEELVLFKVGALFTAGFIVFSASALISFVLRHTQLRMLRFTGTRWRCSFYAPFLSFAPLTSDDDRVPCLQSPCSSEYAAAATWARW